MTARPKAVFALCLSMSLLALSGCEREIEAETAASDEESADLLVVRVGLDAEQQRKLGLSVAPLAAAAYEERIDGQGIVLDAQPVIELMANWEAAEAAARQSRAARERASALFDADAAGSREALEAAERQAAADGAALDVAQAGAIVAYGNSAPWLDASQRTRSLAELRDGNAVLVRANFPGRRLSELPPELVLRPLGAGSDDEQQAVTELWFGPADPNVPGSVLLAYVQPAGRLVTGARLGATLATGSTLEGVVVPASAVVIAGGSAWCYRVLEDDVFLRTAVDLTRPLAGGYFQASDFAAGDEIVVAGAGLLLAHELSGTEEED
jgi:hypothetical protein